MACPKCGSVNVYAVDYKTIYCTTCRNYSTLTKLTDQLTLDFLKDSFQVEPQSKTLKTKVRNGEDLTCAVAKAYRYVQDNKEGYNRVEFKYGPCYIVVAKLRDKDGN